MCFTSARRIAIAALWLGLLSSNAERSAAGGLPVAGGDRPLLYIQGAAAGAHRGDWVSAADGLDDAHRFFVEVPVGLEILEIDLFDADVLAGGASELDKARGRVDDTRVRYQLYDPSGQLVATRFLTGDHRSPRGADRTWLTFYSSRTQVDSSERFADNFDESSYRTNHGNRSFAGPWIESGKAPGTGFDSGAIRLREGRLELSNRGDTEPWERRPSIERELDLSDFAAASLAFDFEASAGVDFEDSVRVELSSDGGKTFYTIEELIGLEGGQSGRRVYDISDHISNTTRVRFRVGSFYAGPDESLLIDNVEIRAAIDTVETASPLPGHWMLAVDMSLRLNRRAEDDAAKAVARTYGLSVNALGLRAHDGDAGHGGIELAIYTPSFLPLGTHGRSGSRQDYSLFPYVTGGCSLSIYDFDWDATRETYPGALHLLSRRGARVLGQPLRPASNLSGNRAWNRSPVSGWAGPSGGSDYGIWSLAVEIPDPDAGNFATLRTDNEGGDLRIYLPSDRGSAPIKPYFGQTLAVVEGQGNPPHADEKSIYAVTLRLVHPRGAAGPLDVGPESSRPRRLAVTASIPDGVGYLGPVSMSAGSLFTQPNRGESGHLLWHPGQLNPGDVATLIYRVEAGAGVDVTGRPGAGGTSARVLDVTGTPLVLGELCQLSVPVDSPLPVFRTSLEPPPPAVEEIHISGEVKNPGTFAYRTAMTLRQALALAGGLTEHAAVTEAVVFRVQNGQELELRLPIDGTLFPGDRLQIPHLPWKD